MNELDRAIYFWLLMKESERNFTANNWYKTALQLYEKELFGV
jgi:hypothetical protein